MRQPLRNLRERIAGNIIVLLAMMITLIFVIGGVSIETSLYLLRRGELQSLAEGVALGSVMSLPSRQGTLASAQSWYDLLRKEGVRELAPAADVSTDSSGTAAFSVSFDDNADTAGVDEPYVVNSITVTIVVAYQPKIFPVLGARAAYSVVGRATAQLRPTDVAIVMDNSGSFYEERSFADDLDAQGLDFPLDQINLASQCYSSSWRNFKKGAILLYDMLSQIGTFRVSVITTTSRTNSPFILIPLGTTKLTAQSLEYDGDQPFSHSTYCVGLSRSELADNTVPTNPNADNSNTWVPRSFLNTLQKSEDFKTGNFQLESDTTLLAREALWILKAGYLTEGFIHPQYMFTSPIEAFKLAAAMLEASRRDDSLPVGQRVVIALMGSDGLSSAAFGWSSDPQTSNTLAEFEYNDFCSAWRSAYKDTAKLGVLYFGHNPTLPHHDPVTLDQMRSNCLIPGSENSGIFFGEVSSRNNRPETDYRDWLIPRVVHGLKQAELVQ